MITCSERQDRCFWARIGRSSLDTELIGFTSGSIIMHREIVGRITDEVRESGVTAGACESFGSNISGA